MKDELLLLILHMLQDQIQVVYSSIEEAITSLQCFDRVSRNPGLPMIIV